MKMNKEATLKNLIARQKGITFESDEDEGAAEHWGEVESCILAIKAGKSDQEIQDALDYVGLSGRDVVWSQS